MSIDTLRHQVINLKPSDKQKKAGNYAKGHIRFHGLDITIENTKGSTREGVSAGGVKWKSTLPYHYGYIKRTTGADRDNVDVCIGPNPDSLKVFVVDQKHHHPGDDKHGKFDEHKCMLGYKSVYEASADYRKAFTDGHDRVLAITIMTMPRFRKWIESGNTKSPVNYFSSKSKS